MTKFFDGEETWAITLDIGVLVRLRDDLDVKLDQIFDDVELQTSLMTDDVFLARVIWVIIQPNAAKLGQDAFFARLKGESIDNAREALWDALVDFFAGPRRTVAVKMRDVIKQEMAKMEERAESLTVSGDSSGQPPA